MHGSGLQCIYFLVLQDGLGSPMVDYVGAVGGDGFGRPPAATQLREAMELLLDGSGLPQQNPKDQIHFAFQGGLGRLMAVVVQQ